MRRALMAALALLLALPFLVAADDTTAEEVSLTEFTLPPAAVEQMTAKFVEHTLAAYPQGAWAPLRYDLDDEDLAALNLPPRETLAAMDFDRPTMVDRDGRTQVVELPAAAKPDHAGGPDNGKGGGNGGGKKDDGGSSTEPTVATFAGAGWFGIRPGALLLIIDGGAVSLCSMAHVYGSAGSYDISTAGHCGKSGATATVIAALGNNDDFVAPVLLDFGSFKTSHDGGVGNDWALIDIEAAWQDLVTPTMVFWGGPRGTYTAEGAVAEVHFSGNSIVPDVSVTPDPTLAQGIAHYGHGLGVGTGGTPRAGTAIHWGRTHFMFEGVLTPGDSGSGTNTLTGDEVGDNMEAAGINTHIYVDPLMREGIGVMAGTRATAVSGTVADGQYVSYPVPVTGLP